MNIEVGNLVSSTHLSVLSSTCEKLEHSAAHDRIAVKNKRRQPAKFRVYNYNA